MTTRTFQQFGQAYGSTPATITATINGTVIYSGEIPTLDTPLPPFPSFPSFTGVNIFTWTNTVDFSGAQSFSISVENSQLLLGKTLADHVIANNLAQFSGRFYSYDIDGVTVRDPFTNVTIGGVAQQRGPDNSELPGQWQWLIPAGTTFTATLNVNAGIEPPPV